MPKTVNYNLERPDFNQATWHDEVNGNFAAIDALIAKYIAVLNVQGVWANSTAYTAGQVVVDTVLGLLFECQVNHTSHATDTFADDRTNNPTYWANATISHRARGSWATTTVYAVGDFVVNQYEYAICLVAHTAGTWATDKASGYWDVLIDADPANVTYEALDAAGDVGTGAGQLAIGNHTHTESDITDLGSYIENVVEDTTPQLGGNLDANGNDINCGDQNINRPVIKDYGETKTAPSSNSGTLTLDIENGNVFEVTLTENVTTTNFNNPSASGTACSFTLILKQDGTGGRTFAWPASVDWHRGIAPGLSTGANDVDILTFLTVDGGTTWYGFLAGADMS